MSEELDIPAEIKTHLSVEQAWYYKIVPLRNDEEVLHLLTSDPQCSQDLLDELELILGKRVVLKQTTVEILQNLLIKNYPKVNQSVKNGASSINQKVQDEGFVEFLITEARNLRSSDIHIESYAETCRIRFRVDGVLIDRIKLSRSEYPILVNKLKIAASCDIAEKRLPQDGRIRIKGSSGNVDIRVSILPTLYGEKIVLRILGTDSSHLCLDSIGMDKTELERFRTAIRKPNGIILISGPTGSGKTTTLYAALKELNNPNRNILTIEDPVEYTLEGINQVQLKDEIGLTYPEALRTFLRQDPDIIMLGEIRDTETAQMAIRAALTGHLVLSTIHTNSAWGTISRLVDMGLPSYILANVINISVAQRLVRVLCENCKRKSILDREILPPTYRHLELQTHFEPAGCDLCHRTGYKGRKAIYEVLVVDNEVSNLIKANSSDISQHVKQRKIQTLPANALALFQSGVTSLEEIFPYLLIEN